MDSIRPVEEGFSFTCYIQYAAEASALSQLAVDDESVRKLITIDLLYGKHS